MSWIRRNLKIVVPLSVAFAAAVAYLAIGVFGVHTLFIDDTVDEDGPVFASGASADAVTDAPVGTDAASEPADDGPSTTKVDKLGAGGEVQASLDAVESDDVPGTTVPATPPVTQPAAPQIVTLAQGTFIPRDHPGEGTAVVLGDGTDQRFLRFENFATDNGPDLNVYLVNSDAAADEGTFDDDFVDLGDLKGNIGDQNYEIPPDVDLAVYDTVVVWCVRFSSAFTAADLV